MTDSTAYPLPPLPTEDTPARGVSATGRMTWMDALRGLAVLAVVLFHSGTLLRYADVEPTADIRAFNAAVAPFRIPMLILLSGMLLPKSVSKGPSRYLAGKARGILWPYLLWSGLIGVGLWWEYGLASVKWLVPSVLVGGTYLWYLFFLVVFYAAALPLRSVPKLPVAAGFLIAAEVMPDDTKYLERLLFLFALFLLGWWLAEHPGTVNRVVSARWTPVVALVVGVVSYLFTDMSGYGPRAVVGTLAGVLVLAWVASRAAGARVLRPLRFVGRNSVVYYVVHFPLAEGLMVLAGLAGVRSAHLLLLASFVAAVAVGTVLARARVRTPFVEGLFVAPPGVAAWISAHRPGRPSHGGPDRTIRLPGPVPGAVDRTEEAKR